MQTIYRLYNRYLAPQPSKTDKDSWEVMSAFDTITPIIRRTQTLASGHQLASWRHFQQKLIPLKAWSGMSHFKRWILNGPITPPGLRADLPPTVGPILISWYPNRNPKCHTLSVYKDEINYLFTKQGLTMMETNHVEWIFQHIIHDLHKKEKSNRKGLNREGRKEEEEAQWQ